MPAALVSALDVWMNGHHVGQWRRTRSGNDRLYYEPAWKIAAEGRPLSLSLPFGPGDAPLSGPAVARWFENLLPDSDAILRRMRDRFGARSTAAFDLLSELGRDCAGAVQLVPAGKDPGDHRRIDAERLDESGVARLLRSATASSGARAALPQEAFRLSIAGAQEKTALLWHQGSWCVPKGATPTTHILKLPMGVVADVRADMRMSVELEWLCMELVREYGLPVANCSIGRFEEQVALVVERFDRRPSPDGWWQRLPQEDFCQAMGASPSARYQQDGGPGIEDIMDILRRSDAPAADRTVFFTAQFLFWLMAATDGHAKNFSVFILPGGRLRLAPLYDVLSLYPVMGRGANQVDPHRAALAMAVQGTHRHYRLKEIHRWHWVAMGRKLGLETDPVTVIEGVLGRTETVLAAVEARLSDGYPRRLFAAVADGMRKASRKVAKEPDVRAARE